MYTPPPMESPPTYEQVQQSGAAAQPVSTLPYTARALHPVLMDIRSSVRQAEELDDDNSSWGRPSRKERKAAKRAAQLRQQQQQRW